MIDSRKMNIDNNASPPPTDDVRASRDGHTYHETWAARIALELLHPSTNLVAITMENFDVEDEPSMSDSATEIADLVRYRGATAIDSASSVEVVQFKYSVARADVGVTASEIKTTLQKFASTDSDFVGKVGAERVDSVVRYEIATNRPFNPNLIAAFEGLIKSQVLEGDIAKQAEYVKAALPTIGERLPNFLKRISLSGTQGTLIEARATVRRRLADWTKPNDPQTRQRLAELRELVRRKAGTEGEHNNKIERVDVLACLGVDHENDLFPAPGAFPDISKVVHRSALDDLIREIDNGVAPLLVDAPGGMGKTILLQSLARRLSSTNQVVLFDCYGGGSWRDPADGRHLPEIALPHIINLLAVDGLCDIFIPGTGGPGLIRSFRLRLEHAVQHLRRIDKTSSLILIVDAIDNAAQQARATQTESFAHQVLLSLSLKPIEGVVVIASCRTERIDIARGEAVCRRFQVPSLSGSEATDIARVHQSDITTAEIADLRSRSDNNLRVFVALLKAGRPFTSERVFGSENSHETLLDALIWERFTNATANAQLRGIPAVELDAMLAALAMLPPPVPLAELAAARGLQEAAVKSFASDLHPLITQSPRGLTFADEPTETLIQRKFQNATEAREAVVSQLKTRQEESNYAARALPHVLTSLNRTEDLINLAFEDRLPRSAISSVAQRAIRLSRLVAALVACARENRYNDLTRLLVEASRIAGGHERSDRFLQDHPDLVAISNDPEALRRLFETRTSWPGRKHASLSVAYTLIDDLDEARRNAQRAFEWVHWRDEQPEGRNNQNLPDVGDLDRFGPCYRALFSGREVRVIQWIEYWNEDYAFRLFGQIESLLERHATISATAQRLRERLFQRASRCRSTSRALFAVLLQDSSLESERTRPLLVRLAKLCSEKKSAVDHWYSGSHQFTLKDSLLSAATKAVRLGMDSEARLILDSVDLRRPRLSEFDSDFGDAMAVQRFLRAACIRAAIEKRAPTLPDISPEEIDSQITAASSRKTARRYDKAVEALLRQKEVKRTKRPSKKKKKGFSNTEREKAQTTLTHRVRPLISFAAALTKVILNSASELEVGAAIDLMAQEVAVDSTYPYHFRSRYYANICFPSIFGTLDSLGAFSERSALTLSNWLINTPAAQSGNMTYVVSRLARHETTRPASFKLGQHIKNEISTETDTSSRINAYGALARAIWLASKAEAQAYFRRGLELADALGSGDYDKITELNEFAAQYAGPPLSPDITHSFARLCELNLPDEAEKFAWLAYGRAMSRICGTGSLAVLSRLTDRGKVDLGYSMPSLLTALVKDTRLSPELAASLIGLDEPIETWGWNLADFLDAVLPLVAEGQREHIFEIVSREMDRRYQGAYSRETVDRLNSMAQKYLTAESERRRDIATLATRFELSSNPSSAYEPSPPLKESNSPFTPEILARISPTSPTAIDSALDDNRENDTNGRWTTRLLIDLGRSIQNVDERRAFLEAVCETKIPTGSEKLTAISELTNEWGTTSTAISDLVPDLAKRLAGHHVSELVDSDWNSSYVLRNLIKFSGGSGVDLVVIVVEGLRDRAQFVSSMTWLRFATVTAKSASADAVRSAIEHFVSKSATSLPADFGEGPFRPNLATPTSDVEIVAGLLWMRLGSPSAKDRWRASHTVRRIVRMGRADVLNSLVAHVNSTDAGPFQDHNLPFFHMHARLWLFIALSRIAIDSPELISSFRAVLEAATFDATFPHVLYRHFGSLALARIAQDLPVSDKESKLNALSKVNVSPWPVTKLSKHFNSDTQTPRAARAREGNDKFYFDYDFAKYELNDIARIFGLPQWKIEDRCRKWIRKWSATIDSMYVCPRRQADSLDRTDSWSGPSHDRFGGYLAWHALMLTAGDLLRTDRVVDFFSFREDPWKEWLMEHVVSGPEGLWSSDGTDPFPFDVKRSYLPTECDEDGVPNDLKFLGSIANFTTDLSLGKNLVVDGFWKGEDKIEFSVGSVIVTEREALNVGLATVLSRPFFRYLPREDHHAYTGDSTTAKLVRPWIVEVSSSLRLDRHDPYCASTALGRPRPAEEIVSEAGLKSTDPFKRKWSQEDGHLVFEAQAWGSRRGEGRYETEDEGSRLLCNSEFLKEFLTKSASQLVLLVRVQKYLEKPRRGDSDRFRVESVLAIVSPKGGVKILRRIPKRARTAVSKLSEYDRDNFELRLNAIRKAMTESTNLR
jgi:hypothetical protein